MHKWPYKEVPLQRLNLAIVQTACRAVGTLALAGILSCAGARFHILVPPAAVECPAGTFWYGDGMVALSVSPDTLAALTAARRAALEAAGTLQASCSRQEYWRPHVSVIYGITPDRAAPAHRALLAFVRQQGLQPMACMGGLQYWDDAQGGKTTAVIDVEEPGGLLSGLHDALAQKAHIRSRWAYSPHVTLLDLQPGVRFTAAQEAAVLAPLKGLCWRGEGYILTDACGQVLHRVP